MQASTAAPLRNDALAMGLVSLAHGLSHFFQLVLPPLFPILREDLGASYTELGMIGTLFYIVSGLSQTPAGFIADRYGAKLVLFVGLALMSGSVALMGLAPSIWWMLPLAVIGGIGNCVFHPADFAIMTTTISEPRLGRAFSVHTLSGNLGWAAAPVTILSLAALFGWRWALVVAGVIGLAALAVMLVYRDALRDETSVQAGREPAPRRVKQDEAAATGLLPLLSTPVVMCFAYFMLLSAALIAINSFLPITLNALFGTPIAVGNVGVTAFLLGGAAGTFVGGVLADRSQRHDMVIACGLASAAAALLFVGHAGLGATALIATLAAAGFMSSMTAPSRDMLVRGIAPKGATGRVFGFVYSGLDAGSLMVPIGIGFLLDTHREGVVLWLIAGALLVAILSMATVRRGTARTAVAAE